jgi:hypothetical protein
MTARRDGEPVGGGQTDRQKMQYSRCGEAMVFGEYLHDLMEGYIVFLVQLGNDAALVLPDVVGNASSTVRTRALGVGVHG